MNCSAKKINKFSSCGVIKNKIFLIIEAKILILLTISGFNWKFVLLNYNLKYTVESLT